MLADKGHPTSIPCWCFFPYFVSRRRLLYGESIISETHTRTAGFAPPPGWRIVKREETGILWYPKALIENTVSADDYSRFISYLKVPDYDGFSLVHLHSRFGRDFSSKNPRGRQAAVRVCGGQGLEPKGG